MQWVGEASHLVIVLLVRLKRAKTVFFICDWKSETFDKIVCFSVAFFPFQTWPWKIEKGWHFFYPRMPKVFYPPSVSAFTATNLQSAECHSRFVLSSLNVKSEDKTEVLLLLRFCRFLRLVSLKRAYDDYAIPHPGPDFFQLFDVSCSEWKKQVVWW